MGIMTYHAQRTKNKNNCHVQRYGGGGRGFHNNVGSTLWVWTSPPTDGRYGGLKTQDLAVSEIQLTFAHGKRRHSIIGILLLCI